jgi:hypothetical protein
MLQKKKDDEALDGCTFEPITNSKREAEKKEEEKIDIDRET